MIVHKTFLMEGLPGFYDIRDELEDLYKQAFKKKDYFDFEMAVIEAMSNAAKYSMDGPLHAKIHMEVRIMPQDIGVKIYSRTIKFNVREYRQKLREIAQNPEYANMDWGDYIGERDESSGFWYMLTGCEYLYMDENGQCITLVAKTTGASKKDKKITRINLLVPRFLIRNEIGVIE